MPVELPSKTPWYKTIPGVIFLSIFIVVSATFVAFGSMVVYYTWASKYGDTKQLAETFKKKFTFNSSSAASANIVDHPEIYVRSDNPTIGSKNAKVTIIEFMDFECPYSRESYATIKQVIEKFSPVVRIVFKHLPAESIHPHAAKASLAAYCAGLQNKFWEYHDLLFEKQQLDDTSLNNFAATLGLNAAKFSACLNNQDNLANIEQDLGDAVALNIRGTPTYIVNGEKIEGVLSLEDWGNIIIKNLQTDKK